eukprot:TRINITY_DN10824_c0_g1_i1.p1 TRINITY_DN10824_c0_g1~~TRINITY_DN10824_c0_g1_i1.p1  ORF type:complete len:529 (-),score=146.10 TRINITY_DN10824_c0_g1_i1:12-1598(-)
MLVGFLYNALRYVLYSCEALVSRLSRDFSPKSMLKEGQATEGNYRPVEASDCVYRKISPSKGSIPSDMSTGMYVRNGPNPKYFPETALYHWFDGDGMLQGIRILPNGEVNYVRHQVKTKRFLLEDSLKKAVCLRIGEMRGIFGVFKFLLFALAKFFKVWGPLTVDSNGLEDGTANTAVVFWSKQFWALHEGSYPFVVKIMLDGIMESVGYNKLGGRLERPFTAHPKIDSEDGKMYVISPRIFDPKLLFTYSVMDKDGRIENVLDLGIKRATFMHDFAITKRFAIFMDLPWVFTPAGMISDQLFKFDAQSHSRFGIMPKNAKSNKEIRWFNALPCYVFHVANAWEEGEDEVVLVACRFEKIFWNAKQAAEQDAAPRAYPYEWRFNLRTGDVSEREIVHAPTEFPTIDPALTGRRTEFAYIPYNPNNKKEQGFAGLIKLNMLSAQVERDFAFGPSVRGGEASFIPRVNQKSEDDGFVITFVHDSEKSISSVYILDATDFSMQCVIDLPERVPHGFHGIFVSEDQIQSQNF